MMKFIFLLTFFTVTHSEKHSLTYFLTASSGLQTFPEFVVVSMVDGVQVGYCDSNSKKAEFKQDWMEQLVKDYPHHSEWHTHSCASAHLDLKADLFDLKQRFNQTGGVHIFQGMVRCEWGDDPTEDNGYDQYGYDGEDFLVFNLKTLTWIAPKLQAVIIKHKRDNDKAGSDNMKNFLMMTCPQWLKQYLHYGKSSLLRTVLPSVSLLRKTPSSPISCHATGFHPHSAEMFWRKDGEQLHEDVEHGEILPNHDGTFQMSVDLNLSLVKPEDRRRYECVFHLPGVKDDIIIELDKAVIRTNWVSPSEFPSGPFIGGVIGLLLLAVCIAGVFIWRRRDKGYNAANSSDSSLETSGSRRSS